jgi:hypothetical protein
MYLTDNLVRPDLGKNLGEAFLQFLTKFPLLIPQTNEPCQVFLFSNENNLLEHWYRHGFGRAVANYAKKVFIITCAIYLLVLINNCRLVTTMQICGILAQSTKGL